MTNTSATAISLVSFAAISASESLGLAASALASFSAFLFKYASCSICLMYLSSSTFSCGERHCTKLASVLLCQHISNFTRQNRNKSLIVACLSHGRSTSHRPSLLQSLPSL
uniref:Uncharacterized protein n=1 Tax=Chaetoceros debilis TaxID=122233 RepID=A0A7S3QAA2_9STRA